MKSSDHLLLLDAWTESCVRLWNLCRKHGRDTDDITTWHAFKLLYLERVPDANKIKGILNDTD